MFLFVAELAVLGILSISLVYYTVLLPPKYPINIPAVPFWVALIPFFKDVDQSDIFRQYIERPLLTHGAVKLFFGAQWNILVHRPSYLAEMFKDEDLYQKSGNQKKIPHSVLAQFLGDNIISSYGDVWRGYQSVVKPGLQRSFEADKIARNANRLCGLLRETQSQAGERGIPVQELLQRYSVANCSEIVLQANLDALSSANAPINLLQSAVKRELFKPIFMNFPFLDRLPFPSRTRAREMVNNFKNELRSALVRTQKGDSTRLSSGPSPDGLGTRMLKARESGTWTEKQLLDNLTVAFVAGQENPQLCMISTLYLLAKHPNIQTRLLAEIQQSKGVGHAEPDPDTLQDMPFLTAVIYESLRLFPPIGQLVNRRASKDALLGGDVVIPKGTYLGYNCYSTNRDPGIWGPTAHNFDPARWGDSSLAIQKQYRQRRAKAEFISFHGGRRACLGEKFAVLQMRITLVALIREFSWTLDPTWVDRKTPSRQPFAIFSADYRPLLSPPGPGYPTFSPRSLAQSETPARLCRRRPLQSAALCHPSKPLLVAMEFSNEGQSFYHRFQGSFLQDGKGRLMHCTGPREEWVRENWTLLQSQPEPLGDSDLKVYRHASQHNSNAVMVNSRVPQAEEAPFEQFFVQLILDQADLCARAQPSPTPETEQITDKLVDLFDTYLRYQGRDDKWALGGRRYFTERIRHFTAQNVSIELCLPAFPCKSSNGDKVTGPDPDRGEELALERLHGFVEAVEKLYQPGAKLWVISDGHVFSDCIGVNDADVDAYGGKLKAMNHTIGLRRGNVGRIGFKSLVDLFQLATVGSQQGGLSTLAQQLNIPTIDHHVNTRVTEEAEMCRRILMAGCGPQKSAVRARIDSKDPAITALYRGFSRFMLEDLEHHPHTRGMSKSQQKKLSAKVAFEMILRNQAYSNLVEMLFPNHVRLSIHAHNNAGPKFGIQLFDPSKVRAVEGLSADGELMTSLDLLHIPTPWHNSVVQLNGSDLILVTKAKLARAALKAGRVTGGVVEVEQGRAHFQLKHLAQPEEPEKKQALSAPPVIVIPTSVRPMDSETQPRTPVVITVTTTPNVLTGKKATGTNVVITPIKLQKPATFAEKADAVVAAMVRRNSGNTATPGEQTYPTKHRFWLRPLRWILSLLWPRGV
ncbi:Pyoverdine/dityrosine biosynthesis protein-domain-containing protein [Chaetomium sp. MPI-SDFR-AT-0129]|nr:Pyoverdine/dityrosine biosynthesis protein-domain-containing protein [Chaetomium sp. MPI-SDFR-AT-0129]